MITINLTDRAGAQHQIAAAEGQSLMEALREGGVDELVALCGGSCSCATCHVYVTSDHALPELGADEDDLLDSSDTCQAQSRLSCQIPVSAALDGICVTVAPEE